MTKKKENKLPSITIRDLIGFILALVYMQSVLTVAHHTSMRVHDGTSQTVGPPAIPALIIGLLVVSYSLYKSKLEISTLSVITLTVFATASIFWLSGLRTNFYF